MERQSLIEWGKYLGLALPLIGASATVVIYVEDIRSSLADVRGEQDEIRDMQATIITTMDRRFDKIEDGHDRVVGAVSSTGISLALAIGQQNNSGEKND